jgi:vacuolar-type H+-ATPase subunit H
MPGDEVYNRVIRQPLPACPRRARPIDIIVLIERLEALVANGRKLPLSSSVIIDQAAALEWIDQLRVTIPEDIKSARRVTNEVERLLEQAREEAEQILGRAQEQATYLIEERELTRQAEELSHEIVRQAQVEGDEIRRGADDYATEVLVGLESEVMRTLKTIKRGLELLDDRRVVASAAAAAAATEAMADDGQGDPDEYFEPDPEEPVRG